MYNRFRELGVPVSITRNTDETLTRDERISKILTPFGNDSQVILLSNHINAGGGEGAEVVYALRNNDMLAKSVLEAIEEEGQIGRKYYQRRLPSDPSQDYYYIMRETKNVTPLLLEYGFIDNANDVVKLQNNLLDYVEAVVRAVTNYIGVLYTPPEGTEEGYYIVKSGDSLWSIANKYGTTVATLRELNNLKTDTLQIGQRLKLPSTTNQATIYTVKSGDSLWSIATKYNVTVDEIIKANNLTTNVLQIGQVLKIPTITEEPTPTPPPQQENYINYTVKSGDSLWSIANRYDTTVDEIRNLNNLTTNVLQIGQVLKIPTTAPEPTPTPPPQQENYINYTVKSGDSLWKIASNYNTTVDEIKNLNNLTTNTLQIGQILKIPTSSAYQTYYVKSGDSLWSIANKFNTTVNELKNINNLTTTLLQIGQELKVPNV